ncbi:hypothetical protein GCM10029992_24360 [Glycomyces albus]
MGFTGTVVSDYWSVAFLDKMHRVTADRAASGAAALEAGIDVELPGTDAYGMLAAKVASGELDEAVVDTAVRRVLLQKADLGLLDREPAVAAPTRTSTSTRRATAPWPPRSPRSRSSCAPTTASCRWPPTSPGSP